VHPDYQRRGIARQLMLACIEMIRARGGKHAILQVDYDNTPAINLYDSLGFIRERAFTTWWRSAITATPPVLARDDLFIAHPRRHDWQQEYELAQSQRSNTMGGIGWLKPLHGGLFRASIWQRIVRMFSFNSMERLVIRADNNQNIVASLWIENGFAQGRTRLTLMAYPDYHDPYAEALLNTALRRFRTTSLVIDHPHDDTRTTQLLETYRFRPHRTLWHMRLSFS